MLSFIQKFLIIININAKRVSKLGRQGFAQEKKQKGLLKVLLNPQLLPRKRRIRVY